MKKTYLMLPIALVLLVGLSACMPAQTSSTLASLTAGGKLPQGGVLQSYTADSLPTLDVTGTGTITATPDIAYINVGVHTEDESVSDAVEQNNTQTMRVRNALVQAGVQAADIQTQNFSVYTMQNYDNSGQPTSSRYAVDNSLSVKVRDLDNLGDLLGAVTNAGANNIYGITFDVADKSELLAQARAEALENAQAQAEEMAENLQVELGDVISVTVLNENYPYPMPAAEGMGGGAAVSAVPIAPGQMVVQVMVETVYILE